MKDFIKHKLSVFIIIFTSTILYGAVSDYNKNSINSIKAIVDEEIITQEDVVKRAAIAIKEAQDRYRNMELMDKIDQILKDTLEEIINRKVLIKEANKLFGIK